MESVIDGADEEPEDARKVPDELPEDSSGVAGVSGTWLRFARALLLQPGVSAADFFVGAADFFVGAAGLFVDATLALGPGSLLL